MSRCTTFLALLLLARAAHPDTFNIRGFATARGLAANGPTSWVDNGYGKLENSSAVADVGIDWTPSKHFLIHAHGLASDSNAGLVAAHAQGSFERGPHDVQMRAGMFFLPTSRENRGDLWTSPYTLSFSAWNSWIGQEFRPIGADLQYRYTTASFNSVTVGGTVFRGNDTMGSLLAWRGWSVGNRLSVLNEVVPLPPLPSLPRFIPAQRRDGTTPFTHDLDGRNGYAARVRFGAGDRGMLQLTHVDNGGDNLLYGNEYAWETWFDVLAAEIGNPETTVFAIEAANGRTSMGRITPTQPRRYANVGFAAGYALLSHKRDANRFSARLDVFRNTDRDRSPGEDNAEDGLAWTLAWLRDLGPHLRAGIEFTQVTADRSDAPEDPDARSVMVELRYQVTGSR